MFYLKTLLFDGSISSFLTSTCFDLFKVTFLLIFFSFSSKYVSFKKLAISLLVANFASFNLSAKCFAVNLLNSAVVIFLLWSGIFLSILPILVL